MSLVGEAQVRPAQLEQELHQGGGAHEVSEGDHDAQLGQIKLHLRAGKAQARGVQGRAGQGRAGQGRAQQGNAKRTIRDRNVKKNENYVFVLPLVRGMGVEATILGEAKQQQQLQLQLPL